MDFLKHLPERGWLLLVGAALLLIGCVTGFRIASVELAVTSGWGRGTLVVVGLSLVLVAVAVEFRRSSTRSNTAAPAQTSLTATEFFHTLDDGAAIPFTEMVRDATRVDILARTAVNLLGQYGKEIERLCATGCTVRALFANPSARSSRALYGTAVGAYRNNVRTATSLIGSLKKKLGDSFDPRMMDFAPTLSLIHIEKRDRAQSFVRVQLYFLHSCIGRDRPLFVVPQTDGWYPVFCDEFEQLFRQGRPWDRFDHSAARASQGRESK